MNILLINSNRHHYPWPVIPHGLYRVAAALEQAGYNPRLLDLCFSSDPAGDIEQAIMDHPPDLVGVSIRNIDNGGGYKNDFFLESLRSEVFKPLIESYQGPLVLGGSAVSISGPQILDYLGLELALTGDGEESMVELAKRIDRDQPIDDLPGLIRRVEGQTVFANQPARSVDIDNLPSGFCAPRPNLQRYIKHGSPIQVQTKRGCPLNCVYCTYNRIEGKAYRLRDPQKVAEEIELMVQTTSSRQVAIVDSNFNTPLGHTKEVLRAIIAKDLDLKLEAIGITPGAVDSELVGLMKQAGFAEVSLGVESACDRVLEGMGKDYTAADVRQAASLFRQGGLPVQWYLLLGGPGETPQTVAETFANTKAAMHPWDMVVIGVGIRAYRGAPISQMMLAKDPQCTRDQFLHPVAYEPEDWDLLAFHALAKQHYLQNPNFLIFTQDLVYPQWLLAMTHAVVKLLAPRRPLWQSFVLARKFEKWLGISALRRVLFRRNYPETLARLAAAEHN